MQQAGPWGNLSNAEYDCKLVLQLYAGRNVYVDKRGWPDLKIRYAAEQHDAFRELVGDRS